MTGINWEQEEIVLNHIALQAAKDEIEKMESEGYKWRIVSNGIPTNEYLYDECGGAYLVFRDKRSKFYKSYAKRIKEQYNGYYLHDTFDLYPRPSRQEKRVNVAVATAVANHLNAKYGDVVYVKSYTD